MSICPSKDLHSVYLDNEMAESYRASYEKHLASCKKCQDELEKYKSLKKLFAKEKEALDSKHFSQKELDDSYSILLTRMSYSKNVNLSKKPYSQKIKTSLGYVIGAVAAVAAFVFVLPGRAKMLKINSSADFTPLARTNISSPITSHVSYDGTLSRSGLSSVFAVESEEDYYQQVSTYTSLASTSQIKPASSSFASYDVFYCEPSGTLSSSQKQEFFNTASLERNKAHSALSKTNLIFRYNSAYNPD